MNRTVPYTYFQFATYAIVGASGRIVTNRTAERIRGFSSLSADWHYGEGKAISEPIIEAALGWNSALLSFGFTTTDAFPGASGEVMITGYYGPHYIEILFETDASVTLTYEIDNREKKCLERVSTNEAYAALQEIAGEIWNTSAYSIQNTLIVSSISSKAWPSETQVAELQFFKGPVLTQLRLQSANTSGDIITASEANLRFFGSSMRQSSSRVSA
jgi:hypothetical protein